MSQNFTPINSTLQDWRNLENVNQNNMSTLNSQIGTEVTSFFPIQPSICSSNINFFPQNKFTLVSSTATTATFGFDANTKIILRFPDQPINGYPGFAGFTDAIQTIFATLTNPSNVITLDPNPSNNYVIAQLSMIASDAYKSNPVTAVLLTTTEANPVADNKIALFKLVTDGVGGLTTAVDANCAFVYNTSPEYILSLFPDIQNNPTTGDVTIGGRIANSVNNIKTLSNDGKLSGMVTGFESSVLYVTEPDGETINTAVVNQYGYRPFHNGTATEILDPANTFAYVSELTPISQAPKYRQISSGGTSLRVQAVYDPTAMIWICSCSGQTAVASNGTHITPVIIDFSSIVTVTGGAEGTVGAGGIVGDTLAFTNDICSFSGNNLTVSVRWNQDITLGDAINYSFSIVFAASAII